VKLDRIEIDKVLSAVQDHLAAMRSEPIELVVCGGSALQVLGLVDRTTRDIDVLALVSHDQAGGLILNSADPLPGQLLQAASIVERDFGLPKDWLNPGPTGLLAEGLPKGLVSRLHGHRYGPRLMVHFIGRLDQICFKMYAALNGGGERHVSDLLMLEPTVDEMTEAACGCLTQDAAEVFPKIVKDFLWKVGFGHVVERLDR
jgi:hypothetical protein